MQILFGLHILTILLVSPFYRNQSIIQLLNIWIYVSVRLDENSFVNFLLYFCNTCKIKKKYKLKKQTNLYVFLQPYYFWLKDKRLRCPAFNKFHAKEFSLLSLWSKKKLWVEDFFGSQMIILAPKVTWIWYWMSQQEKDKLDRGN